jgi:hypothetical protein
MTPQVLTPDDVVAAAVTVEAALRPVAGQLARPAGGHRQDRQPRQAVRPVRE